MLKINKIIKTILLVILNLLVFFNSSKNIIANDLFTELNKLEIGQELPEYIKSQGLEIEDSNQETIYLKFESGSKSYPHFIEVEKTNKILYIELKIPEELLTTYVDLLSELGEPENTSTQSEAGLTLVSFPSKGIGFIVDGKEKLQMIVKYPKKAVEDLINNEGIGFQETSQLYSMPEEFYEPNPTLAAIPKDVIYEQTLNTNKIERTKNIITFLVTLLLFSSVVFLLLYLKNKKKPKILTEEIISSPKRVNSPQIKKPDLVLKIKTPQDPQ
jgi:hypothetical protein